MRLFARDLSIPQLCRPSGTRRWRPKLISRLLPDTKWISTTSSLPSDACSDNHLELASILKRVLEKKAVKVLNDIKRPETPWRVYDLAIRVEYEMVRRNGYPVPNHLSDGQRRSMIKRDIETHQGRLRLYETFRDTEKLADEITLLKLERKQLKHLDLKRQVEKLGSSDVVSNETFHNALGYNVLGPRHQLDWGFSRARAENLSTGNLNYASRFGQNFVLDLDLPYEMVRKETKSLHSQMREIYRVNGWLWEPFNIHLCGYNPDNAVMNDLVTSFKDFMWNVTSECFTRVFPMERLVYLSPDSPNVLTEYSHEDVYILGALIDKRIPKKYSYDKAQRLGIRSARLDLDSYMELTRQKPPYLAFSDVFNVMIDARDTDGNWFYAFQNLINGRKRILRWRDEYEEDTPETKNLNVEPEFTSLLREDFSYKCFEKERAMTKPRRQSGVSE